MNVTDHADGERVASDELARLECPRCGYDQRGVLLATPDAWPLGARCVECGLDYEMVELFRERECPWLFERHWSNRPVRTLVLTLWAVLRPWRFWSDLRMSHRWNVFATTFLMAIGIFIFLLSYSLAYAVAGSVWISPYGWSRTQSHLRRLVELFLVGIRETVFTIEVLQIFGGLLLWSSLQAAAFLTCPLTLRRAKVRSIHILRVASYGFVHQMLIAAILVAMASIVTIVIDDPWAVEPFVWPGLALAACAATVVWWGLACANHLMLPHARAVSILLNIIALLALVLVVVLIWLAITA